MARVSLPYAPARSKSGSRADRHISGLENTYRLGLSTGALTSFSKIHEVGFWKTNLISENEPELGAQYAEQWKRSAILQKGGTKRVR